MVDWAAVTNGAGFLVLACGLGYSFWRNGSSARKAIDDRLTKSEAKILEEIAGVKETCAGARGGFEARLDGHDREFKEVKAKTPAVKT